MSDLVELTSRLLDDGFVICSEKTGDRFTVLLRRTRSEGRRVFYGTGDSFPDALASAAEEAEVPAA
jgi:basic membrane lipoprotein Med (substrate-binding protein (PBP1-ABC) superfamily)